MRKKLFMIASGFVAGFVGGFLYKHGAGIHLAILLAFILYGVIEYFNEKEEI